MDENRAVELLKKALGCAQTDPRNCGECKKCENYATKEDGIEAIRMAIAALEGKDTNVPTNSALDHIHNVVAEREYQRGYEQAKEKYDHKLTVIKGRIKDHYYNKGYEQGKADAIKWIPFKTRPLTEEEKEEHPEWDCFLDCELPDDGQEILITYKNGNKKMVCEDTFFNDDCCYLDSGLELNDEVIAWAKKPAPWEGEKHDFMD